MSSRHINAALTLIGNECPDIDGLYMTDKGDSAEFPAPQGRKWLQIVHTGPTAHWILVSFGFLGSDKVHVYDSLPYNPKSNAHFEACLSSLVKTREDRFTYSIQPCQLQTGGSDCGLFAIAFAIDLALGFDPCARSYPQTQLREIFQKCLVDGQLCSFSSEQSKKSFHIRRNRLVTYKVAVYCDCRRSEYVHSKKREMGMVQCNTCKIWFHYMCIKSKVPKDKRVAWYCHHCFK